MSEFNDDYPQYELMAQYGEEEGKIKRRKLWNIFWIMLGITILELIIVLFADQIGLLEPARTSGVLLKVIIIVLTIGNAFFTLFSFMHLRSQRKSFKYSIILPYLIFIGYLIFVVISESIYSEGHKSKSNHLLLKQKTEMNSAASAEN